MGLPEGFSELVEASVSRTFVERMYSVSSAGVERAVVFTIVWGTEVEVFLVAILSVNFSTSVVNVCETDTSVDGVVIGVLIISEVCILFVSLGISDKDIEVVNMALDVGL